jgi:hypothetical protein
MRSRKGHFRSSRDPKFWKCSRSAQTMVAPRNILLLPMKSPPTPTNMGPGPPTRLILPSLSMDGGKSLSTTKFLVFYKPDDVNFLVNCSRRVSSIASKVALIALLMRSRQDDLQERIREKWRYDIRTHIWYEGYFKWGVYIVNTIVLKTVYSKRISLFNLILGVSKFKKMVASAQVGEQA